ncbi:MAG: C4-type zinc ribbon domain-containing protein [Treponema sp.]|jgi:predicted  nucleic acid-binding Zn-ribbon protein|nr:C4-type zinc ribbon domain-containing protein [Treponema sp.]
MAMEQVFEKLRSLQDVLSQKIALEQEIQEIPKLLNQQEELVSRLKKSFIDDNQGYERARTAEVEYREFLAEAEQTREKAEKNMDSISTQREFEALEKEIKDTAEKEQQYRREMQREGRILAELDDKMKQTADLIDYNEKELAEQRAGIEADIVEKKRQIKAMEQEEQDLTRDLDPEVLFKFERIIRNKMGRGIVAIRGGVCTGCQMILPVQFANEVRLGEKIVFCPYCSRILFYEEVEEGEEEFFDVEDAGSLSDLDDIDEEEEEEEEDEEEEKVTDYEE